MFLMYFIDGRWTGCEARIFIFIFVKWQSVCVSPSVRGLLHFTEYSVALCLFFNMMTGCFISWSFCRFGTFTPARHVCLRQSHFRRRFYMSAVLCCWFFLAGVCSVGDGASVIQSLIHLAAELSRSGYFTNAGRKWKLPKRLMIPDELMVSHWISTSCSVTIEPCDDLNASVLPPLCSPAPLSLFCILCRHSPLFSVNKLVCVCHCVSFCVGVWLAWLDYCPTVSRWQFPLCAPSAHRTARPLPPLSTPLHQITQKHILLLVSSSVHVVLLVLSVQVSASILNNHRKFNRNETLPLIC